MRIKVPLDVTDVAFSGGFSDAVHMANVLGQNFATTSSRVQKRNFIFISII